MANELKKLGLGVVGAVYNPASTMLWAMHADEKLEVQDDAEKAILGIFDKFKSKGVLAATSVYDNSSAEAPCTPQLKHDLIIAIDGADESQLARINEALPFKGEIRVEDNVPSLVVHHEDEITRDATHKTMSQSSVLLRQRYEKSSARIDAALRQVTDEIGTSRGTAAAAGNPSLADGFAALVAGTKQKLQVMR